MISKRIGLERFTDAFIQFQQAPQVVACARGSKNQSSRNLLLQRTVDDDDTEGELGNHLFAFYEKSFIGVYREMSDRVQKRIISIYTCADSGAQDGGASSNAMSAYQDLIRIQDKQIHNLEKQLADLKNAQAQQQQQSAGPFTQNVVSDTLEEAIKHTKAEMHAEFAQQIETIKHQHIQERSELEDKSKTMEAAALAMETRFNGLSVAFEQLEVDHQKQGDALELAARASTASGSIPPVASTAQHEAGENHRQELEALQEKCAMLDGAAKEIFKLLEKQRAKSRELKQAMESVTLENDSLKVQITASQEERDALQARLEEAAAQMNDQRQSSVESEETMRLKALIEKQLEELQELRSLVDKMEALSLASATELEAKNDEIAQLQRSITALEAAAEEQTVKLRAELAESENKLGQNGDNSKFEAAMNRADAPIGISLAATPESSSTESTLEDAYMLLASLEIHCGVLQEKLREAQGDEAVLAAAQTSRMRGAITTL
uniref:Uncharacterized protein n=1 Tax=Globisporangium ultimum (strain ATCC 200006 / CBS 805.95 / DAOM BR144) TaxID=431595 RepID=K3WT51_GLOUD